MFYFRQFNIQEKQTSFDMKNYSIIFAVAGLLFFGCNSFESTMEEFTEIITAKDAERLREFMGTIGNDNKSKLFERMNERQIRLSDLRNDTSILILVDHGYSPSLADFCLLIQNYSDETTAYISKRYEDLGIEDNVERDKLYDGATALQYALAFGKEQTAIQLLENRACLSCTGSRFYHPIYLAVQRNNLAVVKWLIEKDKVADWDYTATDGTNLLHASVLSNSPEMLRLILGTNVPKSATLKEESMEQYINRVAEPGARAEMLQLYQNSQEPL